MLCEESCASVSHTARHKDEPFKMVCRSYFTPSAFCNIISNYWKSHSTIYKTHNILFRPYKKSFKIFQTFLNGFELGLFTTVFIEIMRFKVFLYTHYIKNLMSIINYTQIHNYINYIINKCFDNLKNWLYLRIFFNFIIVHILIVLVSLCNVSLSLSHS